ncbi:MAG TPA: beta-ketoacyl-ACP synthase III [Pirellulales bacterium]|nr:beta-ketoacyl-ACP synthase III [Pirellulales bacterium]
MARVAEEPANSDRSDWQGDAAGCNAPALAAVPTIGGAPVRRLMGVQVLATGSYVPDCVVDNEELATLGYDAEWILQRTGIRERRILPSELATSDMAVAAARRCLARAEVSPADVDLLIVATFTPDVPVPSVACMVQRQLGLSAPAMDLQAACAGFVYAMATAAQFVAAGTARRALVVGADCNSRILNRQDMKIYPLFGDGAGAVLLGPGATDQGLESYTLGADGTGAELLIRPMGGTRLACTPEGLAANLQFLRMDGRAVFKWAIRILDETIRAVLDSAGLTIADLDLFVLHQANIRILDAAAEQLGIDRQKMFVNLDRYGNTSAGSIPLALDEAFVAGRIRPGDRVLVSGFGAGLTWGTVILRW